MRVPRFLSVLGTVALAIGFAGGSAAKAQTAPSLTTNAQNYLPGETVVLMGAGFQPGEAIDVSIAIDDDANDIHIGDYDWMVETADESGEFLTLWTVPLEAFGMTLRATALGLTSGNVATSTFYDDTGTHFVRYQIVGMANASPAVTYGIEGLYPGTGYAVVSVSTNGLPSASVPCTPGTLGVEYFGFTTALTQPGIGTWNLVSINPPYYFPTGISGDTTTVTATYSFTPACQATNIAPTISATDVNLGDICPVNGTRVVTVYPADFNPVTGDVNGDARTVTFSDGSTSKQVVFDPFTPSHILTLKVTDDPSPRNETLCPGIAPLSSTVNVTISASVYLQPTNNAPAVTASGISIPHTCVGSSITVPVSLGDFNATAVDPDGDDIVDISLGGVTQVTLTLPPGVSDAIVSVPVVITATDDPSARDCGVCAPMVPMTGSTTVTVSAHLHRNTAPVISAGNANLGDIVGQLVSGSFRKTVSVSPATFGASATDAEGDAVSITASVGSVTLIGPGMASATVVLTATDNPSSRTAGACAAASSTMSVQVTARIVYNFDGVLFPLNNCVSTKVMRGFIVPVRFRLLDCNGVEVRTVPVNPAGGPNAHTIAIAFNQASAPDGAASIDELGCAPDDGDAFNYYPLLNWIYAFQVNNSFQRHTTYVIRIYTNDGVVHTSMISVK